jgi:hypothetical protein
VGSVLSLLTSILAAYLRIAEMAAPGGSVKCTNKLSGANDETRALGCSRRETRVNET